MTSEVHVQPVRKAQAPPEIRALLEDIQDTMGIPWSPANWRSYAMYPAIARLFWAHLRPAVANEPFLREALAITEHAYREAGRRYRPGFPLHVPERERMRIVWELDAFEFGNPQLLLQQVALSRALRGEEVGHDATSEWRCVPSPYRWPEIEMIDEQEAPAETRALYQDIKQTLGLPIVNSDYQALAKWPAFLRPAWIDLKQWRPLLEYHRSKQDITRMAEAAAERFYPAVRIEENELRGMLGDDAELENLRRMVQMFTDLLPGLIVNDAVFRVAVAAGEPVPAPAAEITRELGR